MDQQVNGISRPQKTTRSNSGRSQASQDSSSSFHDSSSQTEESPGVVSTLDELTDQNNICDALGILPHPKPSTTWEDIDNEGSKTGEEGVSNFYNVVPNPDADEVDLSVLRGATNTQVSVKEKMNDVNDIEGPDDLNALSEIVPNLVDPSTNKVAQKNMNSSKFSNHFSNNDTKTETIQKENFRLENDPRITSTMALRGSAVINDPTASQNTITPSDEHNIPPGQSDLARKALAQTCDDQNNDDTASRDSSVTALKDADGENEIDENEKDDPIEQDISGFYDGADLGKTPKAKGTSHLPPQSTTTNVAQMNGGRMIPTGQGRAEQRSRSRQNGLQRLPSATSVSSATVSTHEVRLPMYLPTFKPATGCTNASDFVVRCFVARLRSGITVVKHGRSRWCKSRLRVLHVHEDGRSLSWKPAQGEPTSSKRPPKLDLSTCMEVRHAWSPDPLYQMYTGTPILRAKCEAANAHKSFALIFPKRTVDITGVTADQCKVLMEGFSALCFRLQVANLAGKNKKTNKDDGESNGKNDNSDEDTTHSNTSTNNSGKPNSPNNLSKKKHG